eukprot:8779936-Ditylum_brightwellii.AAC.1
MKLIEDNFVTLFNHMNTQRHIPENVFDDLGFPKDEVNGTIVLMEQGIEQEWMQRAKVITHPYQQELRDERMREMKIAKEAMDEENKESILNILIKNTTAENSLVEMVNQHNAKAIA